MAHTCALSLYKDRARGVSLVGAWAQQAAALAAIEWRDRPAARVGPVSAVAPTAAEEVGRRRRPQDPRGGARTFIAWRACLIVA